MSRYIATTAGNLEFGYKAGTREIYVEARDSDGDNMLFYLKPYQAAQFAAALEELVEEHEGVVREERDATVTDTEEFDPAMAIVDDNAPTRSPINKTRFFPQIALKCNDVVRYSGTDVERLKGREGKVTNITDGLVLVKFYGSPIVVGCKPGNLTWVADKEEER